MATGEELDLPVAGKVPASEIRERLFPHHVKDFARINHGSYGSAPLPVLREQERIRMQCLAQPDLFLNKQLEGLMLAARQEVALEVGCRDVNHLVLLDNVTTAAAMVAALVAEHIRAGAASWTPEDTKDSHAGAASAGAFHAGDVGSGVELSTSQQGEESHGHQASLRPRNSALASAQQHVVLISSHSYAAVRKCFEHYILPAKGVIETVPLPFPHPTPEAILRSFTDAAERVTKSNRQVVLAVVDHVSSMPSLILPVADIVSSLHACGVHWVFVDGAHAVGSVDVDVEALGADFYSSNLHKWAFAPLSAAFLHCKHAALVGPGAGPGCTSGSNSSRMVTSASDHTSAHVARACSGNSASKDTSASPSSETSGGACNSVRVCNGSSSGTSCACTSGPADEPHLTLQALELDAESEHTTHARPVGPTSGTPEVCSFQHTSSTPGMNALPGTSRTPGNHRSPGSRETPVGCTSGSTRGTPGVDALPGTKGTPGARLHHPVVSHGYDTGLGGECFYTGTRDYSAILAAPAGLRVGRALGGGSLKGLREHNHKGVMAMARMLAAAWGTCVSVPEEMCASMAMVALPQGGVRVRSQEEADAVRDRLREEFRVEAPVLYVVPPVNGRVLNQVGGVLSHHQLRSMQDAEGGDISRYYPGHVRVSHQVYNTEEDYWRLRDAMLDICQKMGSQQGLGPGLPLDAL